MAAEAKSETEKRIQQMVAFINQEARDKAEEIEVRAKEDVNIEVLKMVEREKHKLQEYYKQQEKRVAIEAKIQKQQLLDSFRMKHLQIQDEKIQELSQMAKERFAGIVADTNTYSDFLHSSLIQCFFKIWDEKQVTVQCRREDADLVQRILPGALQAAKEQAMEETGEDLEMTAQFDPKPARCSGGVLVKARRGRVVCDNTLDARLKIILKTELPYVRESLFDQETLSLKV